MTMPGLTDTHTAHPVRQAKLKSSARPSPRRGHKSELNQVKCYPPVQQTWRLEGSRRQAPVRTFT